MFRGFLASMVILLSSMGAGIAAAPASASQCALTPGAVVQLTGTPHLFIVDDGGVLHWGGDTRALAGRYIDWANQCNVGLDALRAMPRGDPWLSSGLVKIGEPIYLSKWEDTDAAPTLLHIQSIADVELFGINTNNYGNFVLDQATWEQRYGFSVGNLQVGPLASAASFAWSPADQAAYSQLLQNMQNVLSASLFRATQSGAQAAAVLPPLADCERPGLNQFDRGRNAGTALGVTQDCLSGLAGGPGPAPGPVPGPGPIPGAGLPLPPGNVRVIPISPTVVRVLWSDVPNEVGYRIYGGDQTVPASLFVTAAPANATSQDLPGLTPSTTYCYAVTAFNPVGESPLTAPVCATTPAPGAGGLAPPTGLVVSQIDVGAAAGGLRLDWTDNSSTEAGFQIVRGGQQIATVGPNVATYSDLSWTPGLPNCYRVVAFNDLGQAPSDQACLGSGGNTAPSAPTGLRATVTAGVAGVQLAWSDTSTNETGFQILRDDQLLATVGANVVTYSDPAWDPAAPSCYRVAAYNDFGTASSDRVCPSTSTSTQPSAPANLAVSAAAGAALRLDWTDTSSNEDGFQILRNNLLVATVGPNTSTYTDPSPDSGQNCYRVAAYNTTGAGYSNQVCRTP